MPTLRKGRILVGAKNSLGSTELECSGKPSLVALTILVDLGLRQKKGRRIERRIGTVPDELAPARVDCYRSWRRSATDRPDRTNTDLLRVSSGSHPEVHGTSEHGVG